MISSLIINYYVEYMTTQIYSNTYIQQNFSQQHERTIEIDLIANNQFGLRIRAELIRSHFS